MLKGVKFGKQMNPKYPEDARREVLEMVVQGMTEPSKLDVQGYDVNRTGTMSMTKICQCFVGTYLTRNSDIPFPCQRTIMAWLKEDTDLGRELAVMHDEAVEVRADILSDLEEDIVFDNTGDLYINADGNRMVNSANVQRAKMMVDYVRGAKKQMNPKKYSEKLEIEGKLEVHTIVGMQVK